jgi:arginine-tRNA-protein transferase
MSIRTPVRFYLTPDHECSYLPGRRAATLFVDPALQPTAAVHTQLSMLGFRRSGAHLYRPQCAQCNACVPVRIPVQRFAPKRRHARALRRNADLSLEWVPAQESDEVYALYARYVATRHGDGDMFPPSREQFRSFLLSPFADTRFLLMRQDGRLVAVAVADFLDDGLSAVYTVFEPAAAARSLGTFAILSQVQAARHLGLPYVYLGYWIADARKMAYKDAFRPLERFIAGRWHRIEASA